MRAIRLTLVACLLMLAASVAAVDSQATARAVEERWQNCSQINRGRLGALHDVAGSTQIHNEFSGLTFLANFSTYPYQRLLSIKYDACVPYYPSGVAGVGAYLVVTDPTGLGSSTYFTKVFVAGSTTATTGPNAATRVVTFIMPDTADAVPMLTVSYTDGTTVIDVTAKCDATTPGMITAFNQTIANHWTMTLSSIEACARFPYTNQALPSGGVAALIICIVCFLLEFAACAKYHRDNKHHSPLDEESMQ